MAAEAGASTVDIMTERVLAAMSPAAAEGASAGPKSSRRPIPGEGVGAAGGFEAVEAAGNDEGRGVAGGGLIQPPRGLGAVVGLGVALQEVGQ